jgi:hypothetical protein
MIISSDAGREPISLYRLHISGSAGAVVGTTVIRSPKNVYSGQMWIQGSTFLGAGNDPGDRGQKFFFWRYPKGGAPYRTIGKLGAGKAGSREASGVTVSLAAPR